MVVGTVIDPELEGEMRVTVVATGLGQLESQKIRAVYPRNDGKPDYESLDRPTVIRNNPSPEAVEPVAVGNGELEYLDIPAFLRRQAD